MTTNINATTGSIIVDAVSGDNVTGSTFGYIKTMHTAASMPGAGNDSNDGYMVGSQWFDSDAGNFYICSDASPGAAVWEQIDFGTTEVAGKAPIDSPVFTGFPVMPSYTVEQLEATLAVAATSGYQVVDVDGVSGGGATGLANDSTEYTATVTVDGEQTPQAIVVVGSAAQTYTDLLIELNADTTGAVWALNPDGNVQCTSATDGETSTVVIADTDLFATLTELVAIDAPVDGVGVIPPTVAAGAVAFATDAAPSPSLVYFDGTNWIDTATNTTVAD